MQIPGIVKCMETKDNGFHNSVETRVHQMLLMCNDEMEIPGIVKWVETKDNGFRNQVETRVRQMLLIMCNANSGNCEVGGNNR